MDPDSIYYPGYFWLWNGPLSENIIVKQLQDMKEHGARSVCVLPMPREFRPDSTNNQLNVSYLSPEFFEYVKIAVHESKRLGMNYWLYDEGGWPSGEACGLVTKNPELKASLMRYSGKPNNWEIQKSGSADRLNSKATQRFIDLTHEEYKSYVGEHFGNTIVFAFTDEPSAGGISPKHQIPWSEGFGDEFFERFGYRIEDFLDAFEDLPNSLTINQKHVRVDLFDFWSQRFVDNYFLPIRQWCRENKVISGGHLGGEDETLGSVIYGYGHILRTLRAMDLPGVDVIWRQVFPHKSNHHFPLYASSVAHQIGSPYAFTESFCVYGNGLTIEQMKWIVDYQYVRGINLFIGGCYPLSTHDHLMCGERPHFGPVNPLWDHIHNFHRYIARIGYILSCGKPKVSNAVYFPVRDMWANGNRDETVNEYENLVEFLLQNQCAFDLIDDDVIADAKIEDGKLLIGQMSYETILCPPCQWMKKESLKKLYDFVISGGNLICLRNPPKANGGIESLSHALSLDQKMRILSSNTEAINEIKPLITFESSDPTIGIRVIGRDFGDNSAYFIFNEGDNDFKGKAHFHETNQVYEIDPCTGNLYLLQKANLEEKETILNLDIPASASRMLLFGDFQANKRPRWNEVAEMTLINGWQARMVRQFLISENDYEVREIQDEWEPIDLGAWKDRFSEDFSGDVAYKIHISFPDEWKNCSMILQLGHVEYTARVFVDDDKIGDVIWSPWEIELPQKQNPFDLQIFVTNTLANVLTSGQVRNAWKNHKEPGWPGPYDARAAEFERESRGGGLFGPVKLKIGYWDD
ncbi:MAG: glycosyl hydrolase [Candidatus Poribacteria bacterium]